MIGLERRQTAAESMKTCEQYENFTKIFRAHAGFELSSGSSGPGAIVDASWSASVSVKISAMATMAALSEYENAMFLELMDDDGLFVTAKYVNKHSGVLSSICFHFNFR